jgi:protease I
MARLKGFRVAVIASDGFEEVELKDPVSALEAEGAEVHVLSLEEGLIQGFHHHDQAGKAKVDHTLDQVRPTDYDALLLPGGALNADAIRREDSVRNFVQAIHRADKPMAVICHAPWILISAQLIEGMKLTSFHTIQDDVRNAGGQWVDEEVVVDGPLVTSRKPDDLPAFNREMIRVFSEYRERMEHTQAA